MRNLIQRIYRSVLSIAAVFALLIVSACDDSGEPAGENISPPPVVSNPEPGVGNIIQCLWSESGFEREKLESVENVVARIADASIACKPNQSQILEFVSELRDRLGDL